ncbi:hypothetical protein J3D54_000228 [Pseudomonas sp. GGS8]|uniref:HNH endonuclease n=1 Tax=Pseudomonas sp. GGS8 TaxID=2817892 RepID=UPI00209F72C4|nr:HNH endonuclease [Pseudomonas sp. GGS8]MCP1441096.1 hypothetical protein [Pseudomonas sp. GGS8]
MTLNAPIPKIAFNASLYFVLSEYFDFFDSLVGNYILNALMGSTLAVPEISCFADTHTGRVRRKIDPVPAALAWLAVRLNNQLGVDQFAQRPGKRSLRALSHEIGRNEIDHIIAKAIVGMARFTYERMNLVAICKRCNKNKSDKPVLMRALTNYCSYPISPDDYLWVHPYIHRYSEHIKIHEGYIFEPIGGRSNKARAEALINACGLSSMPEVEKRRAFESISYASDLHLSVLTAIGQYPHIADNELAKMIIDARAELTGSSHETILNMIVGVRSASFELVEKAVRAASL